jgi:hypothetical protein
MTTAKRTATHLASLALALGLAAAATPAAASPPYKPLFCFFCLGSPSTSAVQSAVRDAREDATRRTRTDSLQKARRKTPARGPSER